MNKEESINMAIDNIAVYAEEHNLDGCDIEVIFSMGLGAFSALQFKTEHSEKKGLVLLNSQPECLSVNWKPNVKWTS